MLQPLDGLKSDHHSLGKQPLWDTTARSSGGDILSKEFNRFCNRSG